MSHNAVLRKVGGSVMLAIPPALLEEFKLAAGRHVAISVESGRLVVEPEARPRYKLEELLAQCDTSAPLSAEDREWLDAPLVGDELL